jgi:hypothetical protein
MAAMCEPQKRLTIAIGITKSVINVKKEQNREEVKSKTAAVVKLAK